MNTQHDSRKELIRALEWLSLSAEAHLNQDSPMGRELAKQTLEHALARAWEMLNEAKGERE